MPRFFGGAKTDHSFAKPAVQAVHERRCTACTPKRWAMKSTNLANSEDDDQRTVGHQRHAEVVARERSQVRSRFINFDARDLLASRGASFANNKPSFLHRMSVIANQDWEVDRNTGRRLSHWYCSPLRFDHLEFDRRPPRAPPCRTQRRPVSNRRFYDSSWNRPRKISTHSEHRLQTHAGLSDGPAGVFYKGTRGDAS